MMIKRLLGALLLILCFASFANAQNTTVSATVTDPNSNVYGNGTWTITFIPQGVNSPSIYRLNGSTFTQQFSGSTNGSGALSQAVGDSNLITPAGSTWQICVTSFTGTSFCYTATPGLITGASVSLSTRLSNASVAIQGNAIFSPGPFAPASVPFILRAAGSQTGNLISVTDYLGNALLTLSSTGTLTCVSGCGGGGGGAVSSVFGRTGAVVSATNDYAFSQISGSASLTSQVTGILPPANGGSGVANTATHTLGTANQNWAALGTGIVKNTTTTGAITDAAFADISALFSGTCNSTTFLRGDGTCNTPSGGGTIGGSIANTQIAFGSASNTIQGIAALTSDTSGNVNANSYTAGTAPAGIAGTATGGVGCTESTSTGWTPTAATDYSRCDSTLHREVLSNNGSAESPIVTAASTDTLTNKILSSSTLSGTLPGNATLSGNLTMSANGAASTSTLLLTGTLFTGGTATTAFPNLYINQGTAPTSFPAAGTMFGLNGPSGSFGAFEDFHLNGGASVYRVNGSGGTTQSGVESASGFLVNTTGGHIGTNAASNDIGGTIAIASGTSATHTFATAYTNAPNCVLTPTSSPSAIGFYFVTTSTTGVTANITISGTITFMYACTAAVN
jgi:hypothetical protein